MLINLFYILLFAIATVIIYIWGMKKEQSKEKELLDNLYKKSEKNDFLLLTWRRPMPIPPIPTRRRNVEARVNRKAAQRHKDSAP